jgi:hypothetical protein
MTDQERIDAVARLGFTERQARFLVTVMAHSGVCLPRQYAAFAGLVYGQKTRNFFHRLVADGHAATCRCLHNRATIYHLRGRALYGANGDGHRRLRRPVPAAAIVPRIMLLDVVLGRPETVWLTRGEGSKRSMDVAGVPTAQASISAESLAACGRHPAFLDVLRIGIEPDGRPVFVFVVADEAATLFRPLLRRLRPLLETLPRWRILVAYTSELQPAALACEVAVRRSFVGRVGTPEAGLGGAAWDLEHHLLPHTYSHLVPLAGHLAGLTEARAEEGVDSWDRRAWLGRAERHAVRCDALTNSRPDIGSGKVRPSRSYSSTESSTMSQSSEKTARASAPWQPP